MWADFVGLYPQQDPPIRVGGAQWAGPAGAPGRHRALGHPAQGCLRLVAITLRLGQQAQVLHVAHHRLHVGVGATRPLEEEDDRIGQADDRIRGAAPKEEKGNA